MYGTTACQDIDMSLSKVATSPDPEHVTACPFVLPGTPVPLRNTHNNGGAAVGSPPEVISTQ
jgi:hypothetical protein